MKVSIELNKEYKTGKLVRYGDWYDGHYRHTIVENVIKFLDDENMVWYQNTLIDDGGGSNKTVCKGKYSVDEKKDMIKADLTDGNYRKVINGSLSSQPNLVVLHTKTYFNGEPRDTRSHCYELAES